MIYNSKILIFGGGGFIGSQLAKHYLFNNDVTVIDICDFNKMFSGDVNITKINYDITDASVTTKLPNDYDYIINTVAILGIKKVAQESINTLQTNIISCQNTLNFALKQRNLVKYLFFSTSEVYGRSVEVADEQMDLVIGPPTEPRWCYAASKIVCEHFVTAYGREHKLPYAIIRPFNVFGENRISSNAMTRFCLNAILGLNLNIDNGGDQIRSWCYIDDFIDGVSKVLESQYCNEIFNIGNPDNAISILNLAKLVIKSVSSISSICFSKDSYNDVTKRTLSISKSNSLLGYSPRISLKQGVDKYIEWLLKFDRKKLFTLNSRVNKHS
jgi:nucleoside-diphosphate-sugar epimerase